MADDIQTDLSAATAALNDFAQGPARRAADAISASFEQAGARIARALGRAAFDGESSFKRMAKVILEELAKVALSQVLSGGSAKAGGALGDSGGIGPAGGVAVHFHLAGGDPGAIARHQGQVAAAVARAVAYGRRNL